MNFDFTSDQKLLKTEARRFLAAHAGPEKARRVLDAGGHDTALWSGVGQQGWLATAMPEEHGGAGFGRIELCAIAEELGRACAAIPFASTVYFVAEALLLAGDDAQKAWLAKVAAGEVIGCFATSETPGPLVVDRIQARVAAGRLSGTKLPVIDGDSATVAIVLAKDEAGPGLFVVPIEDGRVRRETVRTLDPTRGAARLVFEDAPATRLGAAGSGEALLRDVLDRAAVYLAFEQLGGADRCLELAKEYALTRYAFGRPIGSNQAIKHKLADVYVKNELARSHAYYGAWASATNARELPRAAAAARVAASDAYWFATKELIQTFGGTGTTWEADCHLYYRRAQHLALVAGAPATWRDRLVTALAAEAL